MTFASKTLELITGSPMQKIPAAKKNPKFMSERELIEAESSIGRELFGPIPYGHKRDFFCLDEHTWVWYEEWTDADSGKRVSTTTRYEVHPTGILKVQNGRIYKYIEGKELANLVFATRLYFEQNMRRLYRRDPVTGQPLQPQVAA